jgi:hypothetical protein
MINDGIGLKGHVMVEKNGILVAERKNLVVMVGREWVAARFRDDFLDSYNKCNVLSGAQPATSAGPEKCAITS